LSIIQQIYDNQVSEKSRLQSDRELDKRINDIIKRGNFEEDENVSNLFFQAGGAEGRFPIRISNRRINYDGMSCIKRKFYLTFTFT